MARTQVQAELIATNAISGTIIADNAITATHIATNSISGTLVQDAGIVTTMIAANNVTAAKIVSDGVEHRHIHSNIISGQSAVTAASGDYVLIGDTSDSNNLKKALVSDFGVTGISSSADATAITIDSSERVGIGTTSPNTTLHGAAGSNGSGLVDVARFQNTGTTVNDGARIQLTAGTSTSGAGIGCLGVSLNSSHLVFHSGGNNERMRIHSTGHVSINGTANASADGLSNLTVGGGSGDSGISIYSGTGSISRIMFADGTSGGAQYDGFIAYNHSDQSLSLGTGASGGSDLTINSSGNVTMPNLYVADDIGHSGDGDTYLSFENDFLGVYAGGVTCMTTTSTGIRSGNIYLNGVSSNSQIEAGNVHFKVGAGIWMSGSSSLDLQLQVPVTGVGVSTAAKLDAPTGDWYTNDGSVSSLSDSRLKKDITTLTDGMDIVKQLRPVTFKYDDNSLEEDGSKTLGAANDTTRYGFVAQEVETVAPQYVVSKEGKVKGETVSDLKSLSQTRMIPMLVKAIQELEAEVEKLKG